LLRAKIINGRLEYRMRKLYRWNLDDEDHSRSIRQQAREFGELFVDACRNWGTHVDSGGNVVSLSGGHDSRAVAAGIVRSGTPLVAVTYRDPNGKRENEVRCAQCVVRALNIEWNCIDLFPPLESA